MVKVVLAQKIMKTNDNLAACNRRILTEKNIVMINLISGPGAGKTTLLEKTLPLLTDKYHIAVIEGDIYTTHDAERIAKTGVDVVQINTHGACHLDAGMIGEALKQLPLEQLDLVIVENVGNLVCPAEFDLGEDLKIVVASVAEGMDKPAKYPQAFREAYACVITKMDLLPYTDFNLNTYEEHLLAINKTLKIFPVSSVKDQGLTEWSGILSSFLKSREKNS